MRGIVLAELALSEFGDVPVPEKDHDSITWGTVVAINREDEEEYKYLLGRKAHWRRYMDDCRIPENKQLVLIEIDKILGTSYEEDSSN